MSGSKLLVIPVLLFVFLGFNPAAFAEQVSYEYDDYGRLTRASYDDGYALTRISYTYDNVGNFTSESITRQDNPHPQLTVSPQSVDFGVVYSGSVSNQTVTISNTGGDGLSITNLAIGGTDKTDFQITSNGCAGATLPAGGLCYVDVTVAPTSTTPTGAKTATLDITSNDTANPISSVALHAVVSRPTLTVTKQGSGTGNVTSAPGGISCGALCSTTFTTPTFVTLTAAPDLGSTFDGWSGNCSGTSPNCSVDVSRTASVIATFTRAGQNYAVNLTVTGTGSGAVLSTPAGIACNTNCAALFPASTNVTLQPAASQYSIFSGWLTGACSGTADCLLTMNGDKSVTAAFDKDIAHQVAVGSPPTYHATVQAAYSAATNGDVIKLWAQEYSENLVCDQPVAITIRGGYDASYTNITGETVIKGTLTITDGQVIVDGLSIQ